MNVPQREVITGIYSQSIFSCVHVVQHDDTFYSSVVKRCKYLRTHDLYVYILSGICSWCGIVFGILGYSTE
jgi:hypothetical protein